MSEESTKERQKAAQEPSPEDYKGWREVVSQRREALGTWEEQDEKDWEGISPYWRRHLADPPYIRNYHYEISLPILEVEGLEGIETTNLSEPQKLALELAKESDGLGAERGEFLEKLTASIEELDARVEEEVEGEIEEGKISEESRRDRIYQRMKDWDEKERERLYEEYPQLKAFGDRLNQLRKMEKGRELQKRKLEDAIIAAAKQLEMAEWQVLYGKDVPMPHPLDEIRELLESDALEEYFRPPYAQERRKRAEELVRKYYLEKPSAMVLDLALAADLFPPNWKRRQPG